MRTALTVGARFNSGVTGSDCTAKSCLTPVCATGVTSNAMLYPMSAVVSVYAWFVAPAMGAPSRNHRNVLAPSASPSASA